jgi:hypothetical protein
MKKVISFFALCVTGVCRVVAAYFCQFYYSRYHTVVTESESRINSLERRLAALEAHKSRELTPVRFWGVISTSDRLADKGIGFYLSSEKRPVDFFEGINAKGGPVIC